MGTRLPDRCAAHPLRARTRAPRQRRPTPANRRCPASNRKTNGHSQTHPRDSDAFRDDKPTAPTSHYNPSNHAVTSSHTDTYTDTYSADTYPTDNLCHTDTCPIDASRNGDEPAGVTTDHDHVG